MGKLVNRAKMTVSGTPGTGAVTLGYAVSGFQAFAAAGVNNGDVVSYTIEDVSNAWEYGQGTYTSSGTSLARTTILGSSNSGSAISATSSAIISIVAQAGDVGAGRTTVADAAYTILATDRIIAYTSLTAARVPTLPAANAVNAGQRILLIDESGNCSGTNTLTLTRAGSDTINGATTYVLSVARSYVEVESNGSNAWTVCNSLQIPASALPSAALQNATTNTISVGYTLTPNNLGTVSSGTTTLNPALGNYQYITNNGASTIAAPSSDCAIDVLVTNGASAGSLTLTGFTAGSSTGDSYATTNTYKFILMIRRINGVSTYVWKALQ